MNSLFIDISGHQSMKLSSAPSFTFYLSLSFVLIFNYS